MTEENNLRTAPFKLDALINRTLMGGAIGLILIIIYLLQAGEPEQDWSKLWTIKPIIIVPLAGAAGGAFSYFMNRLGEKLGWRKMPVIIFCLVVYIIGLWMGAVLGLDGTWWD